MFLLTLLALLTTAFALPSNIPLPRDTATPAPSEPYTASTPSTADTANVYVCEHINWGGVCTNVPYPLGSGTCVSLDGTASSIRPGEGFSCTFYKNGSCRTIDGSSTLKLKNPGSADLTKETGGWNDAARGFQCFRV